jgi:hypothetical protein
MTTVYKGNQKALRRGDYASDERLMFIRTHVGTKTGWPEIKDVALIFRGDTLTNICFYPCPTGWVDDANEPEPTVLYASDELLLYVLTNNMHLPVTLRSEAYREHLKNTAHPNRKI